MESAAAGLRKPSPLPTTPPASDIITGNPNAAAAATWTPCGPLRRALAPSSTLAAAVAASLLVAAGLGGGALLAWWAVAFHRANAMLWMVPVGLVLLGTPVVACLSVFASGQAPPPPPAPPADLRA